MSLLFRGLIISGGIYRKTCLSNLLVPYNVDFPKGGGKLRVWLYEEGKARMALNEEGSSITIKNTSTMTSPIEMGNNTSPSKVFWVPLKPTRTLLGFRRLSD